MTEKDRMESSRLRSLRELALFWARTKAAERAFVFLGAENIELETLTYAELDAASCGLAAKMAAQAQPGDRVLLMFQTGLSFVIAFFAAHYAGLIPVPIVPPRGERMRDAALSVVTDCQPTLLVSTPDQIGRLEQQSDMHSTLRSVEFMAVDFPGLIAAADWAQTGMPDPHQRPEAKLAFLQYTSGSTSVPKGVCVGQDHLFANLEMQRLAKGNPLNACYVGWAPLYHDMGLIANVLEPFYLGGLSVLMAPSQMAQAPWLWLRAISDYGAYTSGGSNYAFDLCIARASRILRESIDLSCWKVAFNSAEPVRAATIRRFCELFAPLGFQAEAMFACYGMAEATLLVTGGGRAQRPVIKEISKSSLGAGYCAPAQGEADRYDVVGCGEPVPGTDVLIVDIQGRTPLPERQVGEIWVHGPHIPEAYWNRPDSSSETLHASLAGDTTGRRFLRTGDLGVMLDGELYITGRLKDVLIVRGKNIYPQDIEFVAERAYPGLRQGGGAAFSIGDDSDEARIGLAVEVERTERRRFNTFAASCEIRKAVLSEFDIVLHNVWFVETGAVPKTSSGKVRRAESRRRILEGVMPQVSGQDAGQVVCMEGE